MVQAANILIQYSRNMGRLGVNVNHSAIKWIVLQFETRGTVEKERKQRNLNKLLPLLSLNYS